MPDTLTIATALRRRSTELGRKAQDAKRIGHKETALTWYLMAEEFTALADQIEEQA